jgi:RecQ family ATP-dependent DNA helicase
MSRIVLQGQRDEKRREIESNFEARTALRLEFNERLQALQDESHRLEEELQALDDEIEALQESQEEEQEETAQTPQGSPTDSSTRMVVPASTQNDFGTVVRDSRQDRSPSTARSFPWTRAIHHLLRTTFGLHAFRPHQEQVVDATLSGQDVFFLLRTGGGKSLCYQLPALYETAKLTLVVSPLVALLHDQERHLNNLQPNCAVSLQGTVKQQDWQRAFDTRTTRVVFVTPERIAKSKTLWHHLSTLYQRQTLGRFVIDEAHCVSQWGHDFRPDYAQLGRLKQHFPSVPLLCLTATASLRVQQDVTQLLHLSQPLFVTPSSADRPNLRYQVRAKHSATVVADMARYIQDHHAHSAGIIYTLTQNDAQQVAHQLQHHFALPARPYHAGLSDAVKTRTQQDWMTDQVPIIVATIAFGLGIHKPNVRFVLHHTISKTLEAYAQESGRAGRDELPADCVLWYSPKDVMKVLAMISGTSVHTFWPMVRYGQTHGNDALCRAILLTKLGDKGIAVPAVFDQQVHHTTDARTVTNHVRTVLQLIQSQPWTMAKLVQEWRSKNPTLPWYVEKEFPQSTDMLR